MRLDLVLKQSGLIKRRTVAKEFCDRGLVMVNEKTAKPSYEVKDGDKIHVKLGNKSLDIVAHIERTAKKEKASYEPL